MTKVATVCAGLRTRAAVLALTAFATVALISAQAPPTYSPPTYSPPTYSPSEATFEYECESQLDCTVKVDCTAQGQNWFLTRMDLYQDCWMDGIRYVGCGNATGGYIESSPSDELGKIGYATTGISFTEADFVSTFGFDQFIKTPVLLGADPDATRLLLAFGYQEIFPTAPDYTHCNQLQISKGEPSPNNGPDNTYVLTGFRAHLIGNSVRHFTGIFSA